MKKRILLIFLSSLLAAHSAHANLRSVVTLSGGAEFSNISMNQTLDIAPPYQSNYVAHNVKKNKAAGLFLGFERPLWRNISGQLGVGYYINNPFKIQGNISQPGNAAFNDLNYQYKIISQRIFLEGKLLTPYAWSIKTYITGGIGKAYNKAYGYNQTQNTANAAALQQSFNSDTVKTSAYQMGIGAEMDLSTNTRIGGCYRYVNIGKARLGTAPLEASSDVLQNNDFHFNEFLLQLTYLM